MTHRPGGPPIPELNDDRVLVVLPTYNEAENIAEVIARIGAVVPHARLLVVDDGSPDGTADLAEVAGAALGGHRVEVLRRTEKSGLGSAYRAGFRWGMERGFDVLVQIDADLQHDPDVLPELLAELHDGVELAMGSRYIPGGSTPEWAWHRLALSRWGNRYSRWMLRLGVQDATSGLRAYRASLLRRLELDSLRAEGYGYQIEMTFRTRRLGGRIVEIPIRFGDRAKGTSKMSQRIVVEALLLVTWWGLRDRFGRNRTRA